MITSITNQVHKLFSYLLILFSLSSCGAFFIKDIPSTTLSFPEAQYYALIVNNKVIVGLVGDKDDDDLEWYANEGDTELTKITFVENTDCLAKKEYGAYDTLPDGRLQVWKWCLTDKGGMDYLLAYDWNTGQLEKIIGPLPLGSSGASWNPEQTKAIGYLDSKFATKTLFWIYPNRFEPLDLVIKDGNRSWNLQDDFPKFTADDTGKTGTTGRASWSPDGETIVFFASPNAIGKTSFDRFGVEFYLYLMNPETLQYEVVVDNIYSPFLLAWSPDSSHIAFIGKYGFRKENGIWLFSTKTDSITEISKGTFQGIVWRPDGNSLVAIKCQSIDVCDKILEYDLTSILE